MVGVLKMDLPPRQRPARSVTSRAKGWVGYGWMPSEGRAHTRPLAPHMIDGRLEWHEHASTLLTCRLERDPTVPYPTQPPPRIQSSRRMRKPYMEATRFGVGDSLKLTAWRSQVAYACIHVLMYACTYVRMYACMHVCMHACVHACSA